MTPLAAWVLSLMTSLEPNAPWRESYPASAEAFAAAAQEHPLYDGPQKEARTAALLVAIAHYESVFRPNAVGGGGRWLCLLQVSRTHLSKAEAKQVLRDPHACVAAAMPVLKYSFHRCRHRKEVDRLGAYAASTCERGARASRLRSYLAGMLMRKHGARAPREEGDAAASPG